MNRSTNRIDPEVLVGAAICLLSVLGLAFTGALVAEPKVLFGRALTAIPPALFPQLVLASLALLSAAFLVRRVTRPGGIRSAAAGDVPGWRRGVLLFAIMTLYALTMEPVGFLLSSVVALVLVSVLVGNRNPVQIALLAVIAPVALYLVATRLLAVSLPELSAVEFIYARLLGESGGAAVPPLEGAQ